MQEMKGFLADFIDKKLLLQRRTVPRSEAGGETADFMAAARYKISLLCLMKNSRQDLKEIIRLSPPDLSERQATEEFLRNVSRAAEEFAEEFARGVEALARIVLWNENRCLDKFPDQFLPELDSAIKEIFPDAGQWGNITWDAIVKRSEKFLSDNYHDIVTLAVFSRAVTILVDQDNKVARLFFESFRADVLKAIVVNIIQPMASTVAREVPINEDRRQMLLESLSLLQASILAA